MKMKDRYQFLPRIAASVLSIFTQDSRVSSHWTVIYQWGSCVGGPKRIYCPHYLALKLSTKQY